MSIPAFTVIEGWKKDEAQVEALTFMDETAEEAERIYALMGQLERHFGSHPQIGQGQYLSLRLMHRATSARMEYLGLVGRDGGAA